MAKKVSFAAKYPPSKKKREFLCFYLLPICLPSFLWYFSPLVMNHFPSNDDAIHIGDIDCLENGLLQLLLLLLLLFSFNVAV